ncbi:sodium-dependent transporter [Enemella sp. A6]|uniref:sodium-dependent transporter n=1 Tax=Enemella sp. A6 TaxID=3440152 RepID=UPI003EBD042B
MATPRSTEPGEDTSREYWNHSAGFILAAIGSAVGLGNIWRFPGVAYASGSGAFLIPYLVALLTAGIPILFLDYAIGHRFRGAAPLAFRRMAKWAEPLGWFQTALMFVIGVYYAAVIAWAMSFFVFSFDLKWGDDTQTFFLAEYLKAGDTTVSTELVAGVAIPLLLVWLTIMVVLALGVARGVEKLNMVFIPLLVLVFVGLVVRALTLPGALAGLDSFFTPDWAALLDPNVWIAAYAQIFFSLSIAFGIMITYASYQRRKANMTSSGLVVAFANSSFELLAGIGVFATLGFMAFNAGTQVSELEGLTGPILSFVTFPAVISQMPGGNIFGALFFASLTMAGLTSLVSIMQGVAASVQEKFRLGRKTAAVLVSAVCGLLSLMLFSTTSGLFALDTVDMWSNNLGIVISAIFATLLSVWVMRRGQELRDHLNAVSTFKVGWIWLGLVGIVAPIVLLVMLVQRIITLITEGYEGYPTWYTGLFGWGALAFVIVMAIILTALPWRHRRVDDFTPWPPLNSSRLDSKEKVR